jgi:response regulator NasT
LTAERIAPCVLLTAFADSDLIASATDAGVYSYLVKPYKEAELAPAIEVALILPAACQTSEPAAPPAKIASLGHQGLDPASGKAPKQLVIFFHGYTQTGAGAYEVGEESALLESLEAEEKSK